MILIVGASGATGRLLTEELLNRGEPVRVIVRSESGLPGSVKNHKNLSIIRASVLDLTDHEMTQYANGCKAIASCLGHNMTFKGLYGYPRRLVTEAVRRLCMAIMVNNPTVPVKFALMNTVGNRNHDIPEQVSIAQQAVLGLLRLLVPPASDNEKAAAFLRVEIGRNNREIEWSAVRPDSLTDEKIVTPYEVHPSPVRSAIFNPGKTSRINVAHFMAELITNSDLWNQWKGQMPVIYNKE